MRIYFQGNVFNMSEMARVSIAKDAVRCISSTTGTCCRGTSCCIIRTLITSVKVKRASVIT